MAPLVLATVNARYAHASLGLRYLKANLGPLADQCALCEFTLSERPADIVEALLAHAPQVVGFGVYVWNVGLTLEVVRALKQVAPQVVVVLGGPEVSHEIDSQPITALADYVVAGEADLTFAALARQLLAGERPQPRVIHSPPPALAQVQWPYALYSDDDLAHRTVYVEASRGCPFKCEFCLSSLDNGTRKFEVEAFLAQLETLVKRGARQFKFIDRTFNLDPRVSLKILNFFLERQPLGVFAHFELVPDRLPEELRACIAQFRPGALQFEIGIQTFDAETAVRISRKLDVPRTADNLRFLASRTGVHLHTDLIVGLPGETAEQFARGFDQLVALEPHEIQVGILKRLRGTPIIRHTRAFGMVYSESAPYEVLQTGAVPFTQMQALKRFARAWDLVGNSGRYTPWLKVLWAAGSPFEKFMALTEWLHQRVGAFTGISPARLTRLIREYALGLPAPLAPDALDALLPRFDSMGRPQQAAVAAHVPQRQAQHLVQQNGHEPKQDA